VAKEQIIENVEHETWLGGQRVESASDKLTS
jgi:hypothetical protein